MRRTRHRRRFHTDRIVANRRAKYLREVPEGRRYRHVNPKRWGYGAVSDRDLWDCGSHCNLCHWAKFNEPRRAREERVWREDWNI